MQLLIYYHRPDDFTILKQVIKSLSLDVIVDETNDFKYAQKKFQSKIYDVIIVDYTSFFAEPFLDSIFDKKKEQRVLLLNDEYTCFENKNCKHCQKEHNIATIVKPITLSQIATILKPDFQCESYMKQENEFKLVRIIKMVLKKYPFLKFNKNQYFFDLSNVVNPLKTSILIELINIFDNNAIKHHLQEDSLHIVEY